MIVITLAEVMKSRDISGNELAARIGVSVVNLSRIKTGKVKSVKIAMLSELCQALDCQPGDLIKYVKN